MPEASGLSTTLPRPLVERPTHHTYSVGVITLALRLLQKTDIGLTTCRKALHSIISLFDPTSRVPCRSTIANWRDKFGYQACRSSSFSSSSSWAVLVDESITLGGNKILLILGVDLSRYDFTAPLCFSDVEVLDVGFQPGWKAEQIAQRLQDIQDQGIRIAYGVTDRAPNLVRAFRDSELCWLEDCSHAVAKCLEKTYVKDADFVAFEKACTQMKRKGSISRYAHLLPPKLGAHSRFMNIDKGVKWAQKTLKLLEQHGDDQQVAPYATHLQWLSDHRDTVEQLTKSIQLSSHLLKQMKTGGFNPERYPALVEYVDAADVPTILKDRLLNYLSELHRTTQAAGGKYICSTDVVESLFSVTKANAHLQHDRLKELLYCRIKPIEPEQTKQRMEAITLRLLAQYRADSQTVPTTAQRRAAVYNLVR